MGDEPSQVPSGSPTSQCPGASEVLYWTGSGYELMAGVPNSCSSGEFCVSDTTFLSGQARTSTMNIYPTPFCWACSSTNPCHVIFSAFAIGYNDYDRCLDVCGS